MKIKKITIALVCLQAHSINQAMMTGMRKLPMNGIAQGSMRAFGTVGPSMQAQLQGGYQGNSFSSQPGAPASAGLNNLSGGLNNVDDESNIFDPDRNPTMANVDPTILPTGITNDDNAGNTVASPKINVVKEVNAVLGSHDLPAVENNNVSDIAKSTINVAEQVNKVLGDTPLSEFYTQTSNPNIPLPRGVAATIFVPGRSTQQRGFSSSARPAFIPFKPKSNNPYDVLGVSQDATPPEIKAAKLKLAKQYHPDNNPDHKEQATKALQLINNAYDQAKNGQGYDEQNKTSNNAWSHNNESADNNGWSDYDSWRLRNSKLYKASLEDGIRKDPELIKELLKTAKQGEIFDTLSRLLLLYEDRNLSGAKFSSGSYSRTPMTGQEEELVKLMLNKLSKIYIEYNHCELIHHIFGLNANFCRSKNDLIDLLIKKGVNFNFYNDDYGSPFLVELVVAKMPFDIIQKLIVDGHLDLTMKIKPAYNNEKYVGNTMIDTIESWIDWTKNNKDFTSDQRAENIDYYNSVIQLLKQHGAKESSFWDKMKRKF